MSGVGLGLENAGASEFRKCTQEEAINAETEASASSLPSWNAVYLSFKRYAHCDDAAIADGYSEAISTLLAYQWKSYLDLVEFASADTAFESFVIRHIDQTTSADERNRVTTNVSSRCPLRGEKMCAHILERIQEIDRQKEQQNSRTE